MHKQGATRYQKFLKSEKSKTKLKGKKDLPKGTNVTKTNFKVKKIIIKEQLKKHGQTEALSSRKLNARELLSRLSHFNTNARMEALCGIKELVAVHSETLEDNLGHFVHGVTPLVLNVEKVVSNFTDLQCRYFVLDLLSFARNVRRETIKVLHLILSKVDLEKLNPFFEVLSTYLRSAMTHIDTRIQEDSLLFLDILLLCTPRLIAHDFHKIIPNFLDMISKLKVDSKQGRTLTVNLNSQITSVKWRVKVFHRLQQFLYKFAELNDIYKAVQSDHKTTHIFNPSSTNNFPLFNSIYTSVSTMSCFSSKNLQSTLICDEVDKISSYVDTLMPLLFEIWLEASPNLRANKSFETVITEDAAILLKHTLEVISLLWELVKHFNNKNPSSMIETNFTQKYRSLFSQHFVASFPYVTNIRSHIQKSVDTHFEDVITDPKLVSENLEICYLFISINPNVNLNIHHSEINSVLKYIEKQFSNDSQQVIMEVSLRILHTIFSKEVTSWTKSFNVVESLFNRIIWSYFHEKICISFKQKLFSLLCNIAINEKLDGFHSSETYELWLKNLPDILLEETITADTINILHNFAVTNKKMFNNVVGPKLTGIVQNLPKLTVSDHTGDCNSYYKLFSLLYWITTWDNDSFNLLEQQIMNNEYKSDYGKYILDVLKLKTGNM